MTRGPHINDPIEICAEGGSWNGIIEEAPFCPRVTPRLMVKEDAKQAPKSKQPPSPSSPPLIEISHRTG